MSLLLLWRWLSFLSYVDRSQQIVADTLQVASSFPSSEDKTVDQTDKIPPSWSLYSDGKAYLNLQNGYADLTQSCAKKELDSCKHSIQCLVLL